MYIEHTPQGFNIIGISPELLLRFIMEFKSIIYRDNPEAYKFVVEAEKELNNHPNS